METYQIVWTNRAVKDLRKVYSFYSEQAGEEKAFKIIKKLLAKADVLSDARFVQMGATDLALSHLKRDYKKVIIKNIKLSYRIEHYTSKVYIVRVFDMRQNPNKNH